MGAMNRYQKPYAGFSGIGKVAGPTPQQQREAEQASGTADIVRLLSNLAPLAGTAIGAGIGSVVPGAGTMAGAALGGAAGQAVGGLGNAGADMLTRKAEDEDARRQAKIAALQAAFGGRGR